MRAASLLIIAALVGLAAGCTRFPELDVSEAQFDSKTPYPKLVPLEELLKEPEPSITDDLQEGLSARRDGLQATPSVTGSSSTSAPLLERIDALRARRDQRAATDPSIDAALRARMERGITAPSVPE